MKFLTVALAFVACAYADVSELGYSYQQPALAPAPVAPQRSYIPPAPPAPVHQPKNTYIPPAPVQQPKNTYIPPAPVPHQEPKHTYIPPSIPAPAPIEHPKNTYIPPAADDIEGPAQDGYRYKTARRVVYKHRA